MARIGSGVVDWHGEEIMEDIAKAVVAGLDAAGEALVEKYQRMLNVPYPPASRPGQPPHRRSGGLGRAQTHRVARDAFGVALIVGVPTSSPVAAQASALAKGTGRMKARPWIDEAEVQSAADLAFAMAGHAVMAAL